MKITNVKEEIRRREENTKNCFEEIKMARCSQLSFHYGPNGAGGMAGKNDDGKNKILSFKGTGFMFMMMVMMMMMTTTQIVFVILT
jgi:hypothetical protein